MHLEYIYHKIQVYHFWAYTQRIIEREGTGRI